MEDKKLIPRRRVLGLGVALAGLCAGCAVLPAGSTGDFCCRRLFVLPGLRCCRGQVLEIEICLDLLCQFQTGLVETLLVHPDAGADAQYPEILRVVAQTEALAKRERAGRCQLS